MATGDNLANPASLRLLITGGGTGGHVTPALAVVEELRRRRTDLELLWIGSAGDVEGPAAERAGIAFRAVPTGKFRRYASAKTILDAGRVPVGVAQARRLVKAFRPDVIFSTGGFASVPAVVGGHRFAPVLTHEQTAVLGLATRINARYAQVLALSYERTRVRAEALRRFSGDVIVTGNPIRASVLGGDPASGRSRFGFTPDLPMIYVTGGARGAHALNERVFAMLSELVVRAQVLHQAGPASANADAARGTEVRLSLPPELRSHYQVREVLTDELADVFAAADIVISRAGAGTVAELAALGIPAILIPLPASGGGEQDENAQVLAETGQAMVLDQAEASPERLHAEIGAMLGRPRRAVPPTTAAAELADALLALAARGKAGARTRSGGRALPRSAGR